MSELYIYVEKKINLCFFLCVCLRVMDCDCDCKVGDTYVPRVKDIGKCVQSLGLCA